MGAGVIAINALFVLFVLVAIPGPILWAIHADHREHHGLVPATPEPLAEPVLAIDDSMAIEPALA